MATLCPICSTQLRGRSDKLFCTTKCKSIYHYQLAKEVVTETSRIDRLLHKNYKILRKLIPKEMSQTRVSKNYLDQKNFQYQYLTGFKKVQKNKVFHCVYDIAWRKIDDDTVLLIRTKTMDLLAILLLLSYSF